jgi:hypothetical protein
MARIPKGGPRSALDALGAHYEAMTWEQRLQKQRPAGASNGPSAAFNKAYFSPFASPVADLDLRARPDSAFRLGNKWFREIDNGVANVLQQVDDPMVSPGTRSTAGGDSQGPLYCRPPAWRSWLRTGHAGKRLARRARCGFDVGRVGRHSNFGRSTFRVCSTRSNAAAKDRNPSNAGQPPPGPVPPRECKRAGNRRDRHAHAGHHG